MKTIKKVFLVILVSVLFGTNLFAQEEEKTYEPVLVSVTTLHRNSDSDMDFSDWKATEKEYFEKVTMKNDLIIGSGFYLHYFTPDASEIIQVSVYKSWADIDAANDITNKLIGEGWPDDDERDAFFEKQGNYYGSLHSDEIYLTTKYRKALETDSDKPLIYYVKKNIRNDGQGKGFKEYYENITMKNSYIKGYFTHNHLYGSNSREFNEVFVFDNLADIEKAFDEDEKLVKEYWSDDEKRKEFFKGYTKIFSSHGDYIYQNVPELEK